jgi:DNA helicase-2/ATP-dependent DNA helicase PcrA
VDPTALLVDLDADQRRAVTAASTLVAVIAGAGSGKTRVLTRRVAHRIASGGADARHTLVLTFTREAAGELRRRLSRLGVDADVTAATFHSVAHQLLRQRWVDRDEAPRNIATDRARLLAALPIVQAARHPLDVVADDVSLATARGLDSRAYLEAVRSGRLRPTLDPTFVADTLRAYATEKRARGLVDLDDLLALTVDAMRHDPAFADVVRWRFRHVLVDEAQDLNPLQHRLVEQLCDVRGDLFLVGDPAQAIYGFNGSDPALLVDVADRFPGVEVIRLPVNHRSTSQVVDAGRHVLRSAGVPVDVTATRDGVPAVVRRHDDEAAEAADVAATIARADPGRVRHGEIAVLARTHAALAPIRAALQAANVPVRRTIDGAGSAIAPLLDEAYRVRQPDELRRWIRDQHEIANETGDEARREVALAANEFLRHQPTGDGAAFRAWVHASDPFGVAEPGVELLTFHGAKGREWHTVHLVGCETSLVPHRKATTTAARNEEARLFYVAVTRAADELIVHWAERRGGYLRKRTPLLDGFEPDAPATVAPPPELVSMRGDDPPIERLRRWRADSARARGLLPEALVPDATLATIAREHPASADELDELTGLGSITARTLWDGIAKALHE